MAKINRKAERKISIYLQDYLLHKIMSLPKGKRKSHFINKCVERYFELIHDASEDSYRFINLSEIEMKWLKTFLETHFTDDISVRRLPRLLRQPGVDSEYAEGIANYIDSADLVERYALMEELGF